jgi:hypothetical protein
MNMEPMKIKMSTVDFFDYRNQNYNRSSMLEISEELKRNDPKLTKTLKRIFDIRFKENKP